MQSVTTTFSNNASAAQRNVSFYTRVSWTRTYDPSVVFAIVGTSKVGGTDVIKGDSDEFITEADKFFYYDESEYIKSLEYERFIDEPLGGLSMAMGDVVLDNTDKRFTFGYDGDIGDYILPQRVVRLGVGFEGDEIPVFEGVSKKVEENRQKREVHLHCRDYVDTFMGHPMDTQMYIDNRSDEIIEKILIDVGYNSTQYELDVGLNTIGFTWFQKGKKAADAIREICEAEEGHFYQDENGILRFENREHYTWDPHLGSQITFTTDEIIEMEYDYGEIINRCTVTAKPREVQPETVVWSDDTIREILPNDKITVWAQYVYGEDNVPCSSVVTPVEGTDYISNSASDGSGSNMAAYVSLDEFAGFAETAKIVLENSHPTNTAYLTTFQVRGTPAIIINTIKELYEDSSSVALYGQQNLHIENDYIDDVSYAKILARRVVDKYSNPLKRLKIRIKGIPQLQLKDNITITDSDTSESKEYRLLKIRAVFSLADGFTQELLLREITDSETTESPHRIIDAKANIT